MALEYEFEILEPRSIQDALVCQSYCMSVCTAVCVIKTPISYIWTSFIFYNDLYFRLLSTSVSILTNDNKKKTK